MSAQVHSSSHSGVPDHLQRPHTHAEHAVLRDIWDRLNRKNQHAMICLVGEEGSGKSLTSLKLATIVDPTFNADRVMFDVGDLLEMLESGDHEPGQAYVLDEAGVSLGRRTWQERGQVLANQALQLIRSHNLALFFTLPRLSELDSQTIGRLQAFFEITEKVHNQFVMGKWKDLDPDRSDKNGVIYHKKPRVDLKQYPTKVRVDWMKFSPPPDDISQAYAQRKSAHQKQVYKETLEELGRGDDSEDVDVDGEMSVKDVAESIASGNISRYIGVHGGNKSRFIDADLIEVDHSLSIRKAKKVKKILERDDRVQSALTEHTQQ